MINRILVVDDDENLLISLKKILELNSFDVDTESNALKVKELLDRQSYNCVLLDVKMPGMNGLALLEEILQHHPSLPVIMISGQSNIDIAVESIKKGAYDFIEKPVEPDRLLISLKIALHIQTIEEEKESLFGQLYDNYRMIGKSKAIHQIISEIDAVAATNARVLILGKSGTGKELVAWAIHHNSKRRGKPYIKLNCAAIPTELLESELFGHRKGSFTGAVTDHKGKFLAASGGTLFLDEIGDMDLRLQGKLLRALQEDEVEIVGESIPRKTDVRVISASNKDIEKMVEDGKFRDDLLYRLNVIKIYIPPLRERREDIIPLALHFLGKFNQEYNRQILSIDAKAEHILRSHDWPGNVRELRNAMEKIVIFTEGKQVRMNNALVAMKNNQSYNGEKEQKIESLKSTIDQFERSYILEVLDKNDWKIGKTAKALAINRSCLFKKMQKLGINKSMH